MCQPPCGKRDYVVLFLLLRAISYVRRPTCCKHASNFCPCIIWPNWDVAQFQNVLFRPQFSSFLSLKIIDLFLTILVSQRREIRFFFVQLSHSFDIRNSIFHKVSEDSFTTRRGSFPFKKTFGPCAPTCPFCHTKITELAPLELLTHFA